MIDDREPSDVGREIEEELFDFAGGVTDEYKSKLRRSVSQSSNNMIINHW